MRKYLLLPLICLILFNNCTHRVIRSGYTKQKKDIIECKISIVKHQNYPDSIVSKIGDIRLGESGFSIVCSEADAIAILKKEGCSVNADIINITDEQRADLWSSCYRCTAEFYKFKNNKIDITTDKTFDKDKIAERVEKDRQKNTMILVFSVIGGLVTGFLLF